MLKTLDWLDIAEIVKERSLIKSLTILSTFQKEIDSDKISNFIISMIPKMKNEDKDNVLCSKEFVKFIHEISHGNIWDYKNEKGDSLLKNILLSLKEEDEFFLSEQKELKMEKMDNILERVIAFSSTQQIKDNLLLNTVDSYKNKITVNIIQLLIKLNMKKSLLKIAEKGFPIFTNEEEIKSICSVDILEIYIKLGNTLKQNVHDKDQIIPLWIFLLYKFNGYLTLSKNKKNLKNYISNTIEKDLQRKEEIRRYWLKWDNESNDPADYFDSIDGWEKLKTVNQQNVLLKLLERNCNKINSFYRKKGFINPLNECDYEGKNVWGYLFGYNESKNNKLSEKIIPYLRENHIYPTIDKNGKGLIRQSKAMLNLENRTEVEKFVIKTFDNTVWLGDQDEQKKFAHELIGICLSMDKIRYHEYEHLISYIYNFTKMKDIDEELLFSIFVFYALKDKVNVKFENEMSFLKIICPTSYINNQDEIIHKIMLESKNTLDFVLPKLKEAKIYTKMIMKLIKRHDTIAENKIKTYRI